MFAKEKPKRKRGDEISNARACLWVFFMLVVMPAVIMIFCLLVPLLILEALVFLNAGL